MFYCSIGYVSCAGGVAALGDRGPTVGAGGAAVDDEGTAAGSAGGAAVGLDSPAAGLCVCLVRFAGLGTVFHGSRGV